MTHDDETVERVARAICAAFPMGWDGILEEQRAHLRELARAALSALPAPADDALEGLRELSERASGGEWRRELQTGLVWQVIDPDAEGTYGFSLPLFEAVEPVRQYGRELSRDQSIDNVELAARCVNYVRAKLAAPARGEG